MPSYLQQVAYSNEGWEALVRILKIALQRSTSDEKLGGKDRERLVRVWRL